MTTTIYELLTPREAGNILRVQRSTVLRYYAAGLLPGVRVNERTIRFTLEDVAAFVADRRGA